MATPEEQKAAVREIYAAFAGRDLDVVTQVVDRYFAQEIVIREPESLPYGGAYEGRETARALFGGLVDPHSPIDAGEIVIDTLIAADDDVVAAVHFPWAPPGAEPIEMKALERFTFRDLEVVEIQVFLWDVAACLASLDAAVG